MRGLILAVVVFQASMALGAEKIPSPPVPEQLSQVYQIQLRRLDGRSVLCNAQKVVEGSTERKGKWVIIAEITGDPWGFLTWWNAERARRGMQPVAYDGDLSSFAAKNNPPQLTAKCSGHYVVDPSAWQIAFFLWTPNVAEAGNGFLASPSHASVLLDPTIKVAGIALNTDGAGYAWTVNAIR